MLKIIALVNQKGGTSKSSIAMAISSWLHLNGYKTLLIDCDQQGSLKLWSSLRSAASKLAGLDVAEISSVNDLKALNDLDYDYVVMDTAGHSHGLTDAIIDNYADVFLVTSRCSILDLHASLDTSDKIKQTGKPFYYVLTQVASKKEEERARLSIEQAGFPILDQTIRHLMSWKTSLEKGESVYSENAYSHAGIEVNQLCTEIFGGKKS